MGAYGSSESNGVISEIFKEANNHDKLNKQLYVMVSLPILINLLESFSEAKNLMDAVQESVSLKKGVMNELLEVLKLLDEATQRCEEYEEFLRLDDPSLEEYKEKQKENEMRERLNDRQLAKEKE